MEHALNRALELLKEYNVTFNTNVNNFLQSDKTYIENQTLYYESIPRALLYLKSLEYNKHITFLNNFETFGTMIDLSRGAVFSVSYLKEIVMKNAMLGANQVWLYLEDVYDLDVPYFGYLRGKYSKAELQEVVEFAQTLGVEIIPSIQTLGHMEQLLKWPENYEYSDQEDVLLPESEKTKELVTKMIQFCKEVFKTNKIHIGMDETFGLGFGRYYKLKGFKKPEDIFIDHLMMVYEIAKSFGYKDIMIWSDMFFRLYSPTNYYYDYNSIIDQRLTDKIPHDVTLVYWDYYNHNYDVVSKMIKKHLSLNRKMFMASGTWVWTRFTYDKSQTDRTALEHVKACIEHGVKDIIFTQWQDDGAYVDFDTVLLGVFEMSKAVVSPDIPNGVYEYLRNESYEVALTRNKVNDLEIRLEGLIWDDLLLGIYINNYVGYDIHKLEKHIQIYKRLLKEFSANELNHTKLLLKTGLLKLEIRKDLLKKYKKDYDFKTTYNKINKFKRSIQELIESFNGLWRKRNKIYGLEIIQSRLATQLVRADELKYQLTMLESNHEYKLDFLEEKIGNPQYLSLKYQGLATSTKPR